jgi:hypothetical protein
MSEYMGLTMEIGGTIYAKYIPEFLKRIKDDLSDINGPTTEEELRKLATGGKPITLYAQSNYGECESLKSFCQKHHLNYIHTCQASGECDGSQVYWEPGMDDEEGSTATQNGDMTVRVNHVRPLVMLLIEYAKKGDNILPLHMNDEHGGIRNAVEKGLKNPKKFLPTLEEELNKALPEPKKKPFKIKD